MQIIVAANGCTDRTVAIAREVASDAVVLDIAEGSKTGAMNAGHREALHWPRIFLDADVQCTYASLAALATVLTQDGVMAASPALKMDLSRSNWLVRAYYRVWLTQPYVTDAMVGSGCFGLSQAGYNQIGDFPRLTGDDIWVHSRFTRTQRRSVAQDEAGNPVHFMVSPPLRAIDQIRVETRRRLGNAQVLREHPSSHFKGSNRPGDLKLARKSGASRLDVLVYLLIKAAVRARAAWSRRSRHEILWERDLIARQR
jgi:hypothetical protein